VKPEAYAGSRLEVELYRLVEAELDKVAKSLLAGSAKSFEDYKYWTGYAEALKNLTAMIATARKKANT
jgi:hypothetical protein